MDTFEVSWSGSGGKSRERTMEVATRCRMRDLTGNHRKGNGNLGGYIFLLVYVVLAIHDFYLLP